MQRFEDCASTIIASVAEPMAGPGSANASLSPHHSPAVTTIRQMAAEGVGKALTDMECATILCYLGQLSIASTVSPELMADLLVKSIASVLASAVDVSLVPPIDVIFNAATQLFAANGVKTTCCYAFIDANVSSHLTVRHVAVPILPDTLLIAQIARHLGLPRAFGVSPPPVECKEIETIAVTGPSGSGKTVSLLAQSLGKKAIVVYLLPGDAIKCEAIGGGDNTSEAEQHARNGKVLEWLVSQVIARVPKEARTAMARLDLRAEGTPPPLSVLVAVDEMGNYQNAVRAMCSLSGAELKGALTQNAEWGQASMPHVRFFLAVAGTGVGYQERYAAEVLGCRPRRWTGLLFQNYCAFPEGSTSRTYTASLMATAVLGRLQQGVDRDAERRLANLIATHHPLVYAMAGENARLAALVGLEVQHQFGLAGMGDDEVMWRVKHLDVSACLVSALLKWRERRSALRDQSLGDMGVWGCLVKAVRMHFYPMEHTEDAHSFEVEFGLVFNRTLALAHRGGVGGLRLGDSPIVLPAFTTAALSFMLGSPLVLQSVVSGEAFGAYCHGVFFLLACAAGGDCLFSRALANGRLMPLLDPKEEAEGTDSSSDMGAVYMCIHHILPTTPAGSHPIIPHHQFADHVVKLVSEHLKAFGEQAKAARDPFDNASVPRKRCIAAFRSPDKAPFADRFMFVDEALYLFQDKDIAPSVALEGDAECFNMGSNARVECEEDDDEVEKKDKEKTAAQALIERLIQCWLALTGVPITIVRRFIVFPSRETWQERRLAADGCALRVGSLGNPSTAGGGAECWDVTLEPTRCISVDLISFLKFDKTRHLRAPDVGHALPAVTMRRKQPPPSRDCAPEAVAAMHDGHAQQRGAAGEKRGRDVV